MAQVSNPPRRQEANKFIPHLEAKISFLDTACRASTLPSSLTDAQAERLRESISKISQIWTRLRTLDAAIERDKKAKVDKLLTEGNTRLSGPQYLIESVIETNLLAIFGEQLSSGKPLPPGTAPRIVEYFHTAHPDLVLRFCAMIASSDWIGQITWEIFSRLIARMKSATPQIWTTCMLKMFSRLKRKALRDSEEYKAFHEKVEEIHDLQTNTRAPNTTNIPNTLDYPRLSIQRLLNAGGSVQTFNRDPPSSIAVIGEAVTQNRLTAQRQSPLSNNLSYEQHTGYGGSHSNYPDTGYQSGENRHGGAQSNDRQSQHMQHPASEGSQDIRHGAQTQDGVLIAQLPLHIETTSTSQSELSVYESMGFEFSYTNAPIDLILSIQSNPPPELLLLIEGVIKSKRFQEELAHTETTETTCIQVYFQMGEDDAIINFRTTPQIGVAIQHAFGIKKLTAQGKASSG